MITTLLITDLTRMRDRKVCIAGYDPSGKCIRPVFARWRIPEDWLWNFNRPIILPFARVDFNLLAPRPAVPHIEDWVVDEIYRVGRGRLPENERRQWLAAHASPSVQAVFGTEIFHDHGCYIKSGCGCASLGTVQVARLDSVIYETRSYNGSEKWEFRFRFVDGAGCVYDLPITDLSYRYYLDHLRAVEHHSPGEITASLASQFAHNPLYLRLGLTRPGWEKFPDTCHIQINGVYSFPDYLEGKTFADYLPASLQEPAGW